MGQPKSALLVYRELCLAPGGISLRADVPTVWKTNFATTLLMQDNISGAQSILDDVNDADHTEVRKLNAAIETWRSSLSFWQRLQWTLGHQPQRPFVLGFAPGALQ